MVINCFQCKKIIKGKFKDHGNFSANLMRPKLAFMKKINYYQNHKCNLAKLCLKFRLNEIIIVNMFESY